MTARLNSRTNPRSVDELAARVPDHLLDVGGYLEAPEGNMTGLARYMKQMDTWLREELGLPPATLVGRQAQKPPVTEVMSAIGCPASEWYRILLSL